ncbi:MAG: hypothetical protein ACI9XK_003436 [Granulosicoccus sp.]|jgi:hypothetical protein
MLVRYSVHSEDGERELRVMHITHASLLLKANSGSDLNEEEALILDQIYGAYQSHYFHGFGRSTSLGNDGTPQARNFVKTLRENPAFYLFPLRDALLSHGVLELENSQHLFRSSWMSRSGR